MRPTLRLAVLFALALSGCGEGSDQAGEGAPAGGQAAAGGAGEGCDATLSLPEGFCARVVIEDVAPGDLQARHLVVAPNGTIYIGVQGRRRAETPGDRGGVVALRDSNGDGTADQQARFGPDGGTGMELSEGNLYFATNEAVMRFRLGDGLEPVSGPDTLVAGLPAEHSHSAKSIALDGNGGLYVNIGSPTNACQPIGQDRAKGVRGEDPCRQLDTRAGVWRFDANRTRQTQANGERYATGIRNAVALAWNPTDNTLYAAQHGRDQLDMWEGFTPEDNSEGPAEELQRLTRGADFGWPYCYYDTRLKRRVLAPEYGGNGQDAGRCAGKQDPLVAFPGHWAPNDLLFYTGDAFPQKYRNGAFVAFHGSWNRAPVQDGYRVAFVPFQGGQPGQWEDFATGFANRPASVGDAPHRPVGLALGPDGALYISDSAGGRIWKVTYEGGRQTASR